MASYKIAGLQFLPVQGRDSAGKLKTGVYVTVTDWEQWNPTDLSIYMHKQAALWQRQNPFAALSTTDQRAFKIHLGSNAWYEELVRSGGKIDPTPFLKDWKERAVRYREQSKTYWLYR